MNMDCGVDWVDAVFRRRTVYALSGQFNAESIGSGAGIRMSAQCSKRLLGKYMQSHSGINVRILHSACLYESPGACKDFFPGLEEQLCNTVEL